MIFFKKNNTCCVCHKLFYSFQVKNFKQYPFCKKHYNIVSSKELFLIKSIRTNPQDPDTSVNAHEDQIKRYQSGEICFYMMEYEHSNEQLITIMNLYSTSNSNIK
ncbi:MAG: hypothetical protein N4A33_09525 [Bacteriovoracaceae bacterium]|jgi:hypothetical protein|nr:hypothetical protein [Bacteriovoracaceae bacterium]